MYISKTNLVSLKLLDKDYLYIDSLSSTISIDLEGEKSIDLKDYDSNIDVNAITNVVGATLNGSVLSDFTPEVKVTYKYQANPTTVYNVTLDITGIELPKEQNEWTQELAIQGWVEGEYDDSINAPVAIAKYGTVVYSYSNNRYGNYTENLPTSIGTYYVKASVEETDTYKGLESVKSFTISEKSNPQKAQNSWTQTLSIEGWEEGSYNMLINAPKATAKYGAVSYTYSDKVNGIYSKS
ncbi:MAG: hypothetical protein ACK5LC_14500, partial [Coprobacillaceae bacterium]